MGKVRGLVFFFAVGFTLINGQSITLKQYLKSSLEDASYKSYDWQNAFLQAKKSYSLSWIDQVQFRYQDNQFNNYQSRYGLRLDPVNPWQYNRNNQYFRGVQSLKAIEQKMVLKEILHDRYDQVIEYWMTMEVAALTAKQKEIRKQISNAIAQKAGSTDFDADQFLNAQLDVISKEADCQEANFEFDVARGKILEATAASNFDFQLNNLIDVDQVNQLIQIKTNASQTELELLKQRVEISNLKMKLERSDFDIGYLQTIYNSNRRLDGVNTFGLAFGVTIPIVNPNKENVAREKLNVLERQGELEKYQSEDEIKKLNSMAHLKLHLEHYKKLDSLITSVKSMGLNSLAGLSHNFDPIIELKYQEKLLQFEILKMKIKKEILLQYIAYLDNANKLHERPLLNYLSKNLESVEE